MFLVQACGNALFHHFAFYSQLLVTLISFSAESLFGVMSRNVALLRIKITNQAYSN